MGLRRQQLRHQQRAFPAAGGRPPFRRVSTATGKIKTVIVATYGHGGPKHVWHHLTSFTHRLKRRQELNSIVEHCAQAAAHAALHSYRVVTPDA